MKKIEHFIEQHKNWRSQILTAKDSGRYADLSVILHSIDSQYFLGKWLADVTDETLLNNETFKALKTRHKDFRLLTQRIQAELRNGFEGDAPTCCEQFRQVSGDLISLLEELSTKTGALVE